MTRRRRSGPGRLTPPPFAILCVRRAPDGRPDVRLSGARSRLFLDLAAEDFPQSQLGRQLMPRIQRLLERSEGGPIEEDFTFVEGDGGLRALHCHLCRGEAPGEEAVGIVVHDLTAQWGGDQREARRSADLVRLLRLSEVLLRNLPLEEGLRRMVDEIATTPGLRSVVVGLLDAAGQGLRVTAHVGLLDRAPHRPFEHGLGEGPCVRAMRERRLIVESPPHAAGSTSVYLPVALGEELLGVLDLSWDAPPDSNPWSREILASYADYLAAQVALARSEHAAADEPQTVAARDEVDLASLLTLRQQDVLQLLVEEGGSNRRIAQALGLREATVKVHMRRILERLGVARRTEAVNLVHGRAGRWLAARRRAAPVRPAADLPA